MNVISAIFPFTFLLARPSTHDITYGTLLGSPSVTPEKTPFKSDFTNSSTFWSYVTPIFQQVTAVTSEHSIVTVTSSPAEPVASEAVKVGTVSAYDVITTLDIKTNTAKRIITCFLTILFMII